jgi:hypothetical protein
LIPSLVSKILLVNYNIKEGIMIYSSLALF